MWDQARISQAIYRWAKILHMFASERIVNRFQHFPKFNQCYKCKRHNLLGLLFST